MQQSQQDINSSKLSSIRTYLLVAFVFNALTFIGWLFWLVVLALTIVGLVLSVPFLLSLFTLLRIRRMRRAAAGGDVAQLKELRSTGWAIIALIFSGVIPGILLLVANGSIDELTSGPSVNVPVSIPSPPPPPSFSSSVQTSAGSKFCTSCGSRIATSATYCPNCGAPQPSV